MNLVRGYYGVTMEDANSKKTLFNGGFGLNHFKVMTKGLSNEPGNSQANGGMSTRYLLHDVSCLFG